MALPYVKINFANGAIGGNTAIDDNICGLVATGVAVTDKFVLGKTYLIDRPSGLTKLGITSSTSDVNKNIYKFVSEFYTEASEGTPLYLMGCPAQITIEGETQEDDETVTLLNSHLLNKNGDYAPKLLQDAGGKITMLVALSSNITYSTGIDDDLNDAIAAGQALGSYAETSLKAPLFVVIPGGGFQRDTTDLTDLSEGSSNYVCVVVGDVETSSNQACVGLFAGRVAAIPVQRSVARVRTGAILAGKLYIGTEEVTDALSTALHDKGYICPRTFVGKTGYFWSDDNMASSATDDYGFLPRRRTINKAYRIAYNTLLNYVGEEIPVTSDGNIPESSCKEIENSVERAIENLMTNNGNLGVDPNDNNDTGVQCYIDPSQNVVATSMVNVLLRVKPYGYTKYIEVSLGFSTNTI